MKIRLLVAAAATVVASSAMAQSAFEGFYGQLATGYENNQASSLNVTGTSAGNPNETWNASNQSFGGAPLVIGLGYNFSVSPQWLLGLGVDYSAISQKSSSYNVTGANNGNNGNNGATLGGMSLQASNRFNIVLTPGYALDKDKLVYLKAGYSSVSLKQNMPTSFNDGKGGTGTLGSSSSSSTVGGYIVGLGYKQMITSGLYGFGEANYMSYSKPTLSATPPGSGGYNTSSQPSVNSYQLLVGVGYKF
jgi:hypothetical protein